jgi:hypothetical protein
MAGTDGDTIISGYTHVGARARYRNDLDPEFIEAIDA